MKIKTRENRNPLSTLDKILTSPKSTVDCLCIIWACCEKNAVVCPFSPCAESDIKK